MENNNRTYYYGNQEISAPADLDPETVRVAWSEVYPGLENATIEENDDGSVTFVTRAGTKG